MNTYQFKFWGICIQLSTNYTLSYCTLDMIITKESNIITLHGSQQLLIWNQINVKTFRLPCFWLRNACSFTRILPHSWKNITKLFWHTAPLLKEHFRTILVLMLPKLWSGTITAIHTEQSNFFHLCRCKGLKCSI